MLNTSYGTMVLCPEHHLLLHRFTYTDKKEHFCFTLDRVCTNHGRVSFLKSGIMITLFCFSLERFSFYRCVTDNHRELLPTVARYFLQYVNVHRLIVSLFHVLRERRNCMNYAICCLFSLFSYSRVKVQILIFVFLSLRSIYGLRHRLRSSTPW